ETIDAIGLTPDGRLFISTHRSFDTGALTGYGEDLIVLNDNDDSWELYFDGSDVGLGNQRNENIWGAWIDPITEEIYLTTERTYYVSNDFRGSGSDIFICDPTMLGDETSCDYSFFWFGTDHGFNRIILDALWID
ncbi:MAG: hypothetical protein GY943_27195, partial [Chloroflexi bacterium]|nr:hypothetical protein [Chloroflexota bacterium]